MIICGDRRKLQKDVRKSEEDVEDLDEDVYCSIAVTKYVVPWVQRSWNVPQTSQSPNLLYIFSLLSFM